MIWLCLPELYPYFILSSARAMSSQSLTLLFIYVFVSPRFFLVLVLVLVFFFTFSQKLPREFYLLFFFSFFGSVSIVPHSYASEYFNNTKKCTRGTLCLETRKVNLLAHKRCSRTHFSA